LPPLGDRERSRRHVPLKGNTGLFDRMRPPPSIPMNPRYTDLSQILAKLEAVLRDLDSVTEHSHQITDITGLASALGSKIDSSSLVEARFQRSSDALSRNIGYGQQAHQLVLANDSRLTNQRQPSPHSHNAADITGLHAHVLSGLSSLVAGHGSFNPPTSGGTYYFSQSMDLAPTLNPTFREVRVPFRFRLVGVIFHITTGTILGVGGTGGSLHLFNKNTSARHLLISNPVYSQQVWCGVNNSLDVLLEPNTPYVLEIQTPTFTTAPNGVRELATLYLARV